MRYTWFLLGLLISLNLFWSFGKQTLLISVLSVAITLLPDGNMMAVRRTNRSAYFGKGGLLAGVIVLSVLAYSVMRSTGLEFGAVSKSVLFLKNLNLGVGLRTILTYPHLAYLALDASTAGRVFELIVAWNQNANATISTFFGSGFGVVLDLSAKNLLAGVTSYEFQDTRSVQTLAAFLLSRLGLTGVFLGLFTVGWYFFRMRNMREYFWPFFLCLFLAMLAFSTVIKFPFLGVFWGLMASEYSRILPPDRYSRNGEKSLA